jgi:O-antigen/teichoic acid export membrane protein
MRQRIAAFFAGRAFARNVMLLAGSTALAQGSAIVVAPLLTRIYSPADLGLFGVFYAFTSVAGAVACLRYDIATVSAHARSEAAALTVLSIIVAVPATLVCALIAALLILQKWLGFGAFPLYTAAIAGAAALVTAVFGALRYWFIREETFAPISRYAAAQGVTRSIAQVAFGFVLPTWGGLVAGEVLGRLVGIGGSVNRSWRALRDELRGAGPGALRAAASRYSDFPRYNLPSAILDMVGLQIPVPLIAALYSAAVAGELTLVQRLLAVPVSLIAVAVSDAFHARVATTLRENPAALRRLFLRTGGALFLAGIIPILLVVTLGPSVFALVFGKAWRGAGTLAAIVAPLALMQLSVSPLSRVVFVLPQGTRLKLISDVAVLLLAIAALAGAKAAGFTPYAAVGVYVGGQVVAYALYFMLMLKMVTAAGEKN